METTISSDSPEQYPRLLFGRHQGYDLREQWLTKGLLALAEARQPSEQARLFTFPEATDRFGIGPGMVAALRYWLRVTGLMVMQKSQGGRLMPRLTPLGALLAQYDPYLQRRGSLWLLHAHLARNLLLAPTFYWFFQCFVQAAPFSKEEGLQSLLSWAIKDAPIQRINPEVIRKDLECLFRLYTHQPHQTSPEQSALASPFRRLGLLRSIPPEKQGPHAGLPTEREKPQYVLCPPQPGDIPPLIVLALLLEQHDREESVSLTHLLYRQQQIGRTCGVTLPTLFDALNRLHAVVPAWSPRPTMLIQEKRLTLPSVTVEHVLLHYYQQPS